MPTPPHAPVASNSLPRWTANAAIALSLLLGIGPTPGWAQTTPFADRSLFLNSAPGATNHIDFQEFNLAPASGTGFLGPFTEIGFVIFHTNANYSQEIIEGSNIGQAGNNVYTTVAANLGLTIADITFGAGVSAVGLDIKTTGNNVTTGTQTFIAHLFSGSTDLGLFPIVTSIGGTSFQFAGYTSSSPITEILFSSQEALGNQNIVLDNFAIASQVPEPHPFALCVLGIIGLLTWRRLAGRR